jgi:DNA-binding response OmpR family regulator
MGACHILTVGCSHLAVPIDAKLREHGHVVTDANLDAIGWQNYAEDDADVVLLHVDDDWRKASTLCSALRERSATLPIIAAAERYEAQVERALLDAGADDHWAPPAAIDNLVVRVVLRSRPRVLRARHRVGVIEIDERLQDAFVEGHACGLTRREFALLTLLASRPSIVIGRAEVLKQWGFVRHGGSNLVDVHIARLRGKLGSGAAQL